MSLRIGNGYDVHRFADEAVTDASIMLGGIAIPHTHRLLAHSDGDVAIHALCDALLGALALGDIGQHFPDTEPAYKGADSSVFLHAVNEKVTEEGYRLLNADLTLVAQAPKLAPWREQMRLHLAEVLGVSPGTISIKATTTEGLGFTGRAEGIACYAVALLEKTGQQTDSEH